MENKLDSLATTQRGKNTDFSLVEGMFTSDEAREILMSLVKSKLAFHNLKSLQTFEQTGKTNILSENRIEELKSMRHEILKLIAFAEKEGQKLKINSLINVELVHDEEEISVK